MNHIVSTFNITQTITRQQPNEQKLKALLNVTGDDGGLNGYFLMGNGTNNRGQTVGEQKSNGYTASSLNRSVNPWWMNSYASWRDRYNKKTGLPPESFAETF